VNFSQVNNNQGDVRNTMNPDLTREIEELRLMLSAMNAVDLPHTTALVRIILSTLEKISGRKPRETMTTEQAIKGRYGQ
jgi:hypothetical protein